MDVEKLLIQESARQDAYKGLADCYKLPHEGLIKTLERLEQVFETLESEAGTHIVLAREGIKELEEISELKVDYAQLFVGPYCVLAPPYGSVYLESERRVMGDSSMNVQKRYDEAGLTIAEIFKDNPDHIQAELEFMFFLIFKEIEAIQEGSYETVCSFLLKQKSFLQDHLSVWFEDFAQKIVKHSQNNFYQGLAMATLTFLKEDFSEIVDLDISGSLSGIK